MSSQRFGALVGTASLVIASALVALAPTATATEHSAPPPTPSSVVSAVPSTATPAVNNGDVRAIAKVGSTMVIGGTFTQVGGQNRAYLATFAQSNGALSSVNFSIDGPVYAVHAGPTSTTAYVGGDFTTINGVARRDVALVNISTGQVVTSWNPPLTNYGFVNDIVVRGSRVFIGGTFTQVGGKNHSEIASLAVSNGALDAYMDVQLTGHHNDTGSGAQGWPGVVAFDITADGSRLVAVGNFKYADGLLRDQIVQLDLGAGGAAVRTDWATNRLSDQCYNWAFDSWVRDVSFSPDDAYFVVSGTGGGVRGTLCDAASRFESSTASTDAQPTWVSETGGDTTWANAITPGAVYVGGHQRWANNPYGVDNASPGAVPRPGIMALDPISGRPLSWNPGRNPAGIAVYALLATSEGLYMGSNNEWIGNRRYSRPRIAFFPYTGDTVHSTETASLPGRVFLGGSTGGTTNVLYRVNAGGGAVSATDAGPDWSDDSGSTSPYRNSNTNAAGYDSNRTLDGTVPATTPGAVFDSERWSPNDSPAMQWAFPVPAGTPIQVRLYFANRCSCTATSGSRAFNVQIDGSSVLPNYDIVADVGDQRGTMKAFNRTSDGTVNIDFAHVVENPLVNGVEIIRTDVTPTPPTDGLASVLLTSAGAANGTSRSEPAGGVPWATTRGAFMVGSTVFYGSTDGMLHRRTFDGTTFGADVSVNPYHDPAWKDVSNNLGGTYDGNFPSLYGQMSNVSGMTYSAGWLYYTLKGDSRLYARLFSPDSGIMDERVRTVASSVSFADADGMFVSGGKLYHVRSSDGSLYAVPFDGTAVTGSATKVSGSGIDGVSWTNRSLFLYGGPAPNERPTASVAVTCDHLVCSFDGSGSSDPDGTVASYAWTFGDGGTATTQKPAHTFGAAGTFTVGLTVTDNDGATGATTQSLTVTAPPPNAPPTASFTVSCTDGSCAVDGTGSSDSDGTVASYAWAFGDGGTATTSTVTHEYLASGTYDITLTVTDNQSGTGATTQPVTVTVPVPDHPLGFVGAASSAAGSAKFKAATVPTGTQAGDTMLLWLTAPSTVTWTGPSGVTGWTQVDSFVNGTIRSTVWQKTAVASDAGATVRVDDPSGYRIGNLSVAVYRNVDVSALATAHAGDSGTSTHTTPTATAAAGDWVVSYWSDKSSATSDWTFPPSMTNRLEQTDAGTYRFSVLLGDSDGPVPAGQVGAVTATSNATSDKTAMWTVVLRPLG